MKDFDKRKEIVQKLRPIDDVFFQKLMEDRMSVSCTYQGLTCLRKTGRFIMWTL